MGAEPTNLPSQASYGVKADLPETRGIRLPRLPEMSLSPDVLVSYGRMVTAVFALVAIWLDPTRPSREVGTVQIVLVAYLAFSFLMLAITSLSQGKREQFRWIVHAIDIGALSLLVLFSEELDSPFFVFFTFTLITAALQWGMGGIFATALALQILLATSALPDLQDGDSELNILIMRSAYCWLSAVMLGYFATYRERMRDRLARLAAWQPEGGLAEHDAAFSRSLDGTLEILDAQSVIVLWKRIGAAKGYGIVRKRGVQGAVQKIGGDAIDAFKNVQVPRILKPRDPLSAGILTALDQFLSLTAGDGRLSRWRSMCVTNLVSQRHEGVVIVIDGSGEKEQLTALSNIVALRIAAHLGQLASADEQAEAAGLREREEFARNLHDGVLQHLTAAAIHLKVARGESCSQSDRLATVARILFDQQQQIRQFVEGAWTSATPQGLLLDKQLRRLATTLGEHWGCAFEVLVKPRSLQLESPLAAELCLLFSEAAANAVRHGSAQNILCTVVLEGRTLILTIEDDGCGLADSVQNQAIPRSLGARVAMLGGTLEIASSTIGVLITIRILLGEHVS